MPNITEAVTGEQQTERVVIANEMDLRAAEQSLDVALTCCERAGLQSIAVEVLGLKMRVLKLRRRRDRRG